MPQIEELIKNVERALSELKSALVPAESQDSEPIQNQQEKTNEQLFEELAIRF
jgi:hypothetical protein